MNTLITKKLILALALTLFSISAFKAKSWVDFTPKKKMNETEKTISKYFKFPKVLIPRLNPTKNNSVKVEILFSVNLKGEVDFVLAKTSNKELKSEIESQFLKLTFNNLKPETVSGVVLNFKSL
jgi:hypothetical protein